VREHNDLRLKLESEGNDTRAQLLKELTGVKKLLEIEEQKSTKLRDEIQLRDELNDTLR